MDDAPTRSCYPFCPFLAYDVTRKDTFEHLEQWLKELQVYTPGGGKDVVKLLVGNKVDMDAVVTRDQAEEWARANGMLFLECSAKTKVGIQEVFEEVVQKILDNPVLLAHTAPIGARKALKVEDAGRADGGGEAGAGGCC